jgi:Cytochrome C'
MNQKLVLVASISLLTLTLAAHAADSVVKPTQVFMRQKLAYAQGVLEGITLEKFDLVLTNATRLRDMSLTNAFVLLGNQDYQAYKTNFQTSVDALATAAREQNHQKAAEAYSKMTQSCFQCHQTFRREQFVKRQLANTTLENPNPPETNQP